MKYFFYLLLLITGLIFLDNCSVKKETKIIIYNSDTSNVSGYLDKKTQEFCSKNHDVSIQIENKSIYEIISNIQSNTEVDIIRCSSTYIQDLVKSKKIIKSTDLFDKAFFNKYLDEAVKTVTFNNNIWAVPDNYGNSLVLFYNKKFISTPPETSDELIKTAVRFTNKSINQYGLVFDLYDPANLYPWFYGFNNDDLLEKDLLSLNYRGAADTMKFIYDLNNDLSIFPENCNYKKSTQLFKQGNAAFMIDRGWRFPEYYNSLKDDLDIAGFPKVSKTGKYPVTWSNTFCYLIVKKAEKNRVNTLKLLIETLVSEESQREWISYQRFPSLKVFNNTEISKNVYMNKLWYELLRSKALPEEKVKTLNEALRPQLELMINGYISSYDAIEKAGEYISENND